MTFPAVPRVVEVELGLGDTWVDVSGDVNQGGEDDPRGIAINNRGRTSESARVSPTTCGLALANPDGKYVSRNPLGPYAGQLTRNTPLRAAVRVIQDPFTRTVSNGWGTSPDNHPWTSLAATSDYAVNGTAATHTIPNGAAAERISYLADTAAFTHVEVTDTVSVNRTDGNAAGFSYNVLLRGQNTNTYHYVQAFLATDGSVTLNLTKRVAGTPTNLASLILTGLTQGMTLKIKGIVEGQTIRGKVWQASASEPLDWQLAFDDPAMPLSGWAGIRSAANGADTVTRVYTHDDVTVRIPRIFGEVPSWPTEWPIAGNDAYAEIEAAGILRRLSQGTEPVQSALFRGYLFNTPSSLKAYWPCEDAQGASSFASAIVHGVSAMAYEGAPSIAAFSEFACSNPIPVTAASNRWIGTVPSYVRETNSAVTLRFLAHIPAGTTANTIIATLHATGSLPTWNIYYRGGTGDLSVSVVDFNGTALYTGPNTSFNVNDQFLRISLGIKETGLGGVDFHLETYNIVTGDLVTTTASPTGSLGIAAGVTVNRGLTCAGVAVGHISVQATAEAGGIPPTGELQSELRAWAGERAARRIERLCTEEGVAISLMGDPDSTAPMGVQRTQQFLALLNEAADADLGLLNEPLGQLGLAYRSLASFYNQAAALGLNYTTGDLAPPFAPVPDDRGTRNTITVQRSGGSTARYAELVGPLSARQPPAGVGPYPESVTVNVATDEQATHQARWRAHLGTVDEDRYPRLPLDLSAPGLGNIGMAIDVGRRITIDAASPAFVFDQVSQIVLGYSEQISDYHHRIIASCAPESPYRVFELEHADYGRLDTEGSVLAAAIGTGDTALSVATTSGPKWTTAGGDLPMPLMINGEKITATAIANETLTFVAAGTAAQANNASVTPGLPAGHTAGDLLLILAAIHNNGTGIPNVPAGYVTLFDAGNVRLFGKIDNGAEVAPTVSFAGGAAGPTGAQMAAFRGKFYDIASPVINAGQEGKFNIAAQNVAYPGLPLASDPIAPSDNCAVLVLAWKKDNWTSAAAIGGMTEIGEYTTFQSGIGQGVAWDYVIQTTATDIAAGSVTVTGGVSAISMGAALAIRSDRQAVTVTRNGNGVSRAHAVGAPVELYYRTALAL